MWWILTQAMKECMCISTTTIYTLMSMIMVEKIILLSQRSASCCIHLQMELLLVLLYSVKIFIYNKFKVSSKSAEGAQNAGLGLIIFLALLLHKAPAALGFGSFLRHEGIHNNLLIKHLAVRLIKISNLISRPSLQQLQPPLSFHTSDFYSGRVEQRSLN